LSIISAPKELHDEGDDVSSGTMSAEFSMVRFQKGRMIPTNSTMKKVNLS